MSRLMQCAGSVPLLFALAVASAAAQSRAAIRFAEMDRNGDRAITREEWRGSPVSFDRHDWNGDGRLSGEEVRPGGRRSASADPFDSPYREYGLADWSTQSFDRLDHDRNGRLTIDEWHYDRESFRRVDHNRDGAIARAEFLGEGLEDDDLEDRFRDLDANNDGRIARGEWHGGRTLFDALDDNRDGVLTRVEMMGDQPPPDMFSSLDVNRDGVIARSEWHWSNGDFDQRDVNADAILTREELFRTAAPQDGAYRAGYDRGQIEGRTAGREERQRNQPWDLEGQRELETADSGYEARLGPKVEYQRGYRDGFRRAYREGWEAAGR